MLSFFSKKKQSPENPSGSTIGESSEANTEGFIMVDNQHPGRDSGFQHPGHQTLMMPMYPYSSSGYVQPSGNVSNTNQVPVPYLIGIPFMMSAQLSSNKNFEITQMEADGILALMTKEMQLESDYDFKLERAVLNECY